MDRKGKSQARSNSLLQSGWEDEQLSREAAVYELIQLRREVHTVLA